MKVKGREREVKGKGKRREQIEGEKADAGWYTIGVQNPKAELNAVVVSSRVKMPQSPTVAACLLANAQIAA